MRLYANLHTFVFEVIAYIHTQEQASTRICQYMQKLTQMYMY